MIPPFRREFDAARDPVAAQYALGILPYQAWTPGFTFATPGDLSVVLSTNKGTIFSIGKFRIVNFASTTSTFTHTTASGAFRITGLPFMPSPSSLISWGGGLYLWQGITKANYTHMTVQPVVSQTYLQLIANGSGVAAAGITTADMPTGGTVSLRGQLIYQSL